jgi:hypothetical protein
LGAPTTYRADSRRARWLEASSEGCRLADSGADTGGTEIHISDRHSIGHMSMEASRDGTYQMMVSKRFIDQMMGEPPPTFLISKASEASD